MIYVVFLYSTPTTRAPAEIDIADYRAAGTVSAQSHSEATRKWNEKQNVRCTGKHRRIQIADVLKINADYWIYCPNGQWAAVDLLTDD